jgi:PKD repeat protein
MKRIVFSLLLLGLVMVPCMAYTEVGSFTEDRSAGQAALEMMWITGPSFGTDVTRLTWSGDCYKQADYSIPTSYAGHIREGHAGGGGAHIGNYSATIDYHGVTTYGWSTCDLIVDTQFDTATNDFYLDDINGGSNSQWYSLAGEGNGAYDYTELTGYQARLHVGTPSIPQNGVYKTYTGTSTSAPVASFTCAPTSQYPDTSVVCTDTSTNVPTDWLWSIDMEGAGIDGWQTHTGQNFTWESHYPGLYSVNLRANNSAGSDWENKSNYVSISLNATPNNCNLPVASGYIRTYAQTNDGMTSGGIYGSQIQMRDMEGGAWSNTTSSEGYWCIDTLPGHSLNLYAQASGYTSTSQLGVAANGGRYYLVLWPDYIPAPSSGNVSLYVLIYDQQTGSPLYLSSVRVDGNNINTILKNTGPEGQAVFTIKNNTAIHVTASKAGYNTITRTMTTSNTGPDTLMISLPRSTVTVAPTQTTGPGGTVPTTIGPYGTPGPGGTMAPGYTNNQGQLMMDFLARNGLSLVELCFFVTVLALLGVKLGK